MRRQQVGKTRAHTRQQSAANPARKLRWSAGTRTLWLGSGEDYGLAGGELSVAQTEVESPVFFRPGVN